MSLPIINHDDYVAKINDDNKFPIKKFGELARYLISEGITKKFIIEISKKDYFIDCSKKDLTGVITAIKNSQFFIGNNSGPLNLSAALGVESFGLIANDAISELKYSKIQFITPKNYKDNTWIRDRKNMKTLTPDEVFNFLENKIR